MPEKQDPDYKKEAQENPRLDPSKPYPLEGVLVVDLTRVLSGPTCTRILADAGAMVIHVERPPKGDDTRSMGPYVADGSSDYFRIANVGKESIALDFRNPDDHAFLMKMIAKADVVVENFRPGVMAKNGLDPERSGQKVSPPHRLLYIWLWAVGPHVPGGCLRHRHSGLERTYGSDGSSRR